MQKRSGSPDLFFMLSSEDRPLHISVSIGFWFA